MPTGTPFHGRIVEYPSIRVDAFQTPRDAPDFTVNLYLLTHTHADHITGLDSPSFSQLVLCSEDAKHMLLSQERYVDRIAYDRKEIGKRVLPWSHLLIEKGRSMPSRDLLRPIPLNTPQLFQLNGSESVTITAIDANHCPGSVMYLIEGSHGAVLHTGDMRAEPCFLDELRRNKYLARYLAQGSQLDYRHLSDNVVSDTFPSLEAIYLDTACLMGTAEVLSKVEAAAELVQLIALYPPHTRFFLNAWTWGYEDVIKTIAHSFGVKIHVDRYKKGIFAGLKSDPLLDEVTTIDPYSTRFHACERFARCECVPSTDREVVYVNPVECPRDSWESYRSATAEKLLKGELVKSLIVPLSRHSTLPELQEFVRLFKPKRVVPNTVLPQFGGADWACISNAFDDCMTPGGADRVDADMRANGYVIWNDLAPQHASSQALALLQAAISDDYGDFGPFTSTAENYLAPPGSDGEQGEVTGILRQLYGKAVRSSRPGRKLRTLEHFAIFLGGASGLDRDAVKQAMQAATELNSADQLLLQQLNWSPPMPTVGNLPSDALQETEERRQQVPCSQADTCKPASQRSTLSSSENLVNVASHRDTSSQSLDESENIPPIDSAALSTSSRKRTASQTILVTPSSKNSYSPTELESDHQLACSPGRNTLSFQKRAKIDRVSPGCPFPLSSLPPSPLPTSSGTFSREVSTRLSSSQRLSRKKQRPSLRRILDRMERATTPSSPLPLSK